MDKLSKLRKLRKELKNEYGDIWIGLCHVGKDELSFLLYEDKPVKVVERGKDVEKFEVKRIPLHVIYIDSSIEEFERAEVEKNSKKAAKSYWGSVLYALKALGLIKMGCRIVEVSLETVAKYLPKDAFEKFLRLKNLFYDQFDVPEDVELVRHYSVAVLISVLDFYFSANRCE